MAMSRLLKGSPFLIRCSKEVCRDLHIHKALLDPINALKRHSKSEICLPYAAPVFLARFGQMDSSQKACNQAGQAKGQTQEKGNQMMDKASNAAQSAKENMQQAGEQAKAKAQGAADTVKNSTGMNN